MVKLYILGVIFAMIIVAYLIVKRRSEKNKKDF